MVAKQLLPKQGTFLWPGGDRTRTRTCRQAPKHLLERWLEELSEALSALSPGQLLVERSTRLQKWKCHTQ